MNERRLDRIEQWALDDFGDPDRCEEAKTYFTALSRDLGRLARLRRAFVDFNGLVRRQSAMRVAFGSHLTVIWEPALSELLGLAPPVGMLRRFIEGPGSRR